MVEHGHFANNEYQQKLHDLHDGAKHYVPTVVPHGYFGVDKDDAPKTPDEMPEEKPNMVPPGHFAKVAKAIRDARLSKTFGSEKSQKEGACDILDHVLDLGRFIYEAEQTVDKGIAGAGTAINGLLDVVCPLIEMRYPDAARCMPKCDALKERVTKLSDPQFIGEIKTKKQKCEKTKGRDVNYALLAGLVGSDMLFGTNFCPQSHADGPSCDKSNMEVEGVAEDATGGGADGATGSADPTADIKAAEKLVLQTEGLTWHQHQIQAMDDEEGTERLPVSPDMNSTKIECDRDCKVRKQVEREMAEKAAKEEGAYDVHQEEKIGEEVTDKEAEGAINSERSEK
jgi:hypothetical protein